MSNPAPLTFRIGLQTYSIDNHLPGWHPADGVPACSTCDRPLHFIWASPPSSGLALCGCTPANDGRKIVQSQANTTCDKLP
jgi:hypothetical protein